MARIIRNCEESISSVMPDEKLENNRNLFSGLFASDFFWCVFQADSFVVGVATDLKMRRFVETTRTVVVEDVHSLIARLRTLCRCAYIYLCSREEHRSRKSFLGESNSGDKDYDGCCVCARE